MYGSIYDCIISHIMMPRINGFELGIVRGLGYKAVVKP